jgi:ketosteroid isomerase-like protein
MFEAHAADDIDAMLALAHPDIEADAMAHEPIRGISAALLRLRRETNGGTRTEVHAHRFVVDGDEVLAYGRLRVIDHGRLADSPAAWRFTVRDGRVTRLAPLRSAAALPHVA